MAMSTVYFVELADGVFLAGDGTPTREVRWAHAYATHDDAHAALAAVRAKARPLPDARVIVGMPMQVSKGKPGWAGTHLRLWLARKLLLNERAFRLDIYGAVIPRSRPKLLQLAFGEKLSFPPEALQREWARAVVWQDDAGLAFRIAEDGSPADVHDQPCQPGPGLYLWHSQDRAFYQQWARIFGDYKLIQPFPQLELIAHQWAE